MKKLVAASALLFAFAEDTNASTLDFSDVAANTGNWYSTSLVSGGFSFSKPSGFWDVRTDNPGANNGSNALSVGYGGFSFAQTNNNAFSLNSFDAGASWYTSGGSVTLTGYQANGNVLTQVLGITNAYQNYIFNWTNLLSVNLSANSGSGYVAYDNIVVGNPVTQTPIPAAAWLFGSALTGLVGIGKRKKAVATNA